MKTAVVVVVTVAVVLCMACLSGAAMLLPDITASTGTTDDQGEPPPSGECACFDTPPNCGVAYPGPVMGWPVPGTGWGNITAVYCDPEYLILLGNEHHGIDISAVNGTPVVATVSGSVVRAGYDSVFGMGWNVKVVSDDGGWTVYYFHLDDGSLLVSVGDHITYGEHIADVDNTGASTGSHLHYEIHGPDGLPVDPAPTMAH